jgi:hypothetical protein
MRGPLQPFVAEGMSSRELNNEDYFSDHPKRLPIFDALFRAQAQLSPDHFSRNLERRSGHHHCSQDDYQRAVFLFRRLESARRTISKVLVLLLAMSLVPFVCVAVPEECSGRAALLAGVLGVAVVLTTGCSSIGTGFKPLLISPVPNNTQATNPQDDSLYQPPRSPEFDPELFGG